MEDTNLKTWPERIYLQHGCDDIPNHDEVNSDGAVTWCADNINELDIEYVRADLVALSSPAVPIMPVEAGGNKDSAFWGWIEAELKAGRDHHVFAAKAGFDAGRALPQPETETNMQASEREAFEKSFSDLYEPHEFEMDAKNDYKNPSLHDAWVGWQASAALCRPPAPQPVICEDCGDTCMARNPGVCGNCYAMKYRDAQPPAVQQLQQVGEIRFDENAIYEFIPFVDPSIDLHHGMKLYATTPPTAEQKEGQ